MITKHIGIYCICTRRLQPLNRHSSKFNPPCAGKIGPVWHHGPTEAVLLCGDGPCKQHICFWIIMKQYFNVMKYMSKGKPYWTLMMKPFAHLVAFIHGVYSKHTSDLYVSFPKASTKHESHFVRVIGLHKAGPGAVVHLRTMHKLIQVHWNAGIWGTPSQR